MTRAPIAEKHKHLRRPRVEPTKRKSFTPAQRRAVYEAQDGVCGAVACDEPLSRGWDIDHDEELWFGGAHDPSNWVGLCKACHKAKTGAMAKVRAHVKRLIARDEEIRPSRIKSRNQWPTGRKLQSRPFEQRKAT